MAAPEWMPSAITGFLGVIGGWLSGRGSVRTAHINAESAPYGAISERVVQLECRVGQLEAELRSDRQWIMRTIIRVLRDNPDAAHVLIPWPAWYDDQDDRGTPS